MQTNVNKVEVYTKAYRTYPTYVKQPRILYEKNPHNQIESHTHVFKDVQTHIPDVSDTCKVKRIQVYNHLVAV